MNRMRTPQRRIRPGGFTLVELLVVILIIVVMAVLVAAGASRFIENGRKVKAMAQFRDLHVGLTLFENDYQRVPIPVSKRGMGIDTIYGDPDSPGSSRNYGNEYIVSVLAGDDKEFPAKTGENFAVREDNVRNESYIVFPFSPDKKGGVGDDGRLYDPWGREVIMAMNAFKGQNERSVLVNFAEGRSDKRLYTWRLAEYTETKPKEQSCVFWSYGKDGKKGKGGQSPGSVVPLKGSDDVISW